MNHKSEVKYKLKLFLNQTLRSDCGLKYKNIETSYFE